MGRTESSPGLSTYRDRVGDSHYGDRREPWTFGMGVASPKESKTTRKKRRLLHRPEKEASQMHRFRKNQYCSGGRGGTRTPDLTDVNRAL